MAADATAGSSSAPVASTSTSVPPTAANAVGLAPHQPSQRFSFPVSEKDVLKYWTDIDAFQESLRQSEREGRPLWSFYDGPPFATGLPHYGSVDVAVASVL